MTPLFKKLNFKQQKGICILNHPPEFETELNAMKEFTDVHTRVDDLSDTTFVLAFVQTKAGIDRITPELDKKLEGDGILWFAYPKKSSKKYSAEISRDVGWAALGDCGFEGVRAVAIDEDWSALRFRRVEFIKTMKRHPGGALSDKGKERTKKTT